MKPQFYWMLLLSVLCTIKVQAQITTQQLADARRVVKGLCQDLQTVAKNGSGATQAKLRITQKWCEPGENIYNDLIPGNDKVTSTKYEINLSNRNGFLRFTYLDDLNNATVYIWKRYGVTYIIIKRRKRISGETEKTRVVENHFVYSTKTKKIAYVAKTLFKGAVAYGDSPQPPPDRDGDGIPDSRDACPDTYARTSNGCPAPPPPTKKDQTFTVKGVSFKMVYVQGGSFTMGCTDEQGSDCYNNEKPAHRVTLSSYQIGETEVTQELWQAVMGSNPSSFSGCPQCPVENVSWNDAQQFIKKLNSLTGKNFRLPTEAEWEYAARGGKKSQGYKYAGSNDIDAVGWYGAYSNPKGNSEKKTNRVKGKRPNELGLYDMSGNVYEWCQDWYGDYSSSSQTNPQGPSRGSLRVLRGGSWNDNARYTRVSYRNRNTPDLRGYSIGFRLTRTK